MEHKLTFHNNNILLKRYRSCSSMNQVLNTILLLPYMDLFVALKSSVLLKAPRKFYYFPKFVESVEILTYNLISNVNYFCCRLMMYVHIMYISIKE